jgi:hypothetical protein
VAGGAAVVGLAYSLVNAPATTIVTLETGIISQKTFEAMGVSPEAAAACAAVVTAPVAAWTSVSSSLSAVDKSGAGLLRSAFNYLKGIFKYEPPALTEIANSKASHIYVGGAKSVVGPGAKNLISQNQKSQPWGNQDPFKFFMSEVEKIDFSSPSNKAIFYSGKGSRDTAYAHKLATGKLTIEDTPGGKWLESFDLFSDGGNSPVSKVQAELIWNRASQRYAENVSGEITLFVHKSVGTRTFYQHEFPALQKNKRIHRWSYKD